MESLKRRMIRAFVAAIALLAVGLMIACQGPAGPAGAAGGKGDQGTAMGSFWRARWQPWH